MFTADGAVLPYNTKDSLLNPEFLVGDASYPWIAELPSFPEK